MPLKTYRDLNELRPYVRIRADEWIARCKESGLVVYVSETYRSDVRQAYLYEQKLSTVKVTGAHGFRVALDFYFVEAGKTAYPTGKMTAAAQIAKALGFEWGGDWTSFRDMPHLQMLGGVSLAQYRQGKRPLWYGFETGSVEVPESILNPEEDEMKRYNSVDEIQNDPELASWATDTIEKLVSIGILRGKNDDTNKLDLTLDFIRMLVINDRVGLYG